MTVHISSRSIDNDLIKMENPVKNPPTYFRVLHALVLLVLIFPVLFVVVKMGMKFRMLLVERLAFELADRPLFYVLMVIDLITFVGGTVYLMKSSGRPPKQKYVALAVIAPILVLATAIAISVRS